MTNSKNTTTRSEILDIVDTYEGMIKQAWARGERAEALLAKRTEWCYELALIERAMGLR